MKTFLRNIKSDSYFGLLMKKPEMNPHGAVFMSNVLDEFETRFLKNDRAREQVFNYVLSHIRRGARGFTLSGLGLYDPDAAAMRTFEAAYDCGGPYWLIPAHTYKAVISRDLAKRQGRISRGVSTRTLEDCALRIMHNVGVLLVNEDMMEGDTADGVCDFGAMFPAIKAEFCAAAGKEIAAEINKNGELSQNVGFAFWWYYMVSSSFVGPEDPQFPVSNTDRDDTWGKIQNMLNALPANPDDDQFIVFINRFIDLCHGRGSLAGAFVEGGAKTCSEVSNMAPDELYESIYSKRKTNMKKKYTKKQIVEAIAYWKTQLKKGNYRKINESDDQFKEIDDIVEYLSGKKDLKWIKVYKFQRLEAIQAKGGERVKTIGSDGNDETDRVAKKGDWIANNVSNRENKWIIDDKTFKKKYEEDADGVYKPKGGPMLAAKVSDCEDTGVAFAPPNWGGDVIKIRNDGWFMKDPTNEKDIYAISKKDFDSTYKPIK